MLKKKNDYSAIVFLEENDKPKKWTYVHNLSKFVSFLEKEHPSWKYLNLYNRRGQTFIKQFIRGDFIPPYPQL